MKTQLQRLRGKLPRLTLLGRAVLLISGCLLFNAACWVAAGLCLTQADGLIGLALLAWTLGLRHGLDADHISAIDNATRQMVSLGRLPLTCGLFFSLGHSTIVIVVNIAIAISASVYDKLDGFGEVGGVIGASVSSSFLFLVACINSYFLIGAVRHRRRAKARARAGLPPEDVQAQAGGCLVRACAPLLRAVDRPWKLYPVGLLFGLGFDTASSIALLAMSALAAKGPHGSVSGGRIVVLPFLFTAGMSLVDSLDSVLMLYAYAQPELKTGGKWRLFKSRKVVLDETPESVEEGGVVLPVEVEVEIEEEDDDHKSSKDGKAPLPQDPAAANYGSCSKAAIAQVDERDERAERMLAAKTVTISSLSISLTLLSILVALAISLIQIMGLIGEHCAKCTAAAEDPNGGGLAGSWWRAWARANDASGYVGAAIVGFFVAILVVFHLSRWGWKKNKARKAAHMPDPEV